MRNKLALALLANMCIFVVPCSAHYLWITIDKKSGEHGATNIYFEGGASPGDGHYLDQIKKYQKTWIRTVEQIKPQLLKTVEATKPKKRWLTAKLKHSAPRGIDSYAKFGVYRYGKTDVLLHYYARILDVAAHEDLHELARAKHMNLDIVPHDQGGNLRVDVLWMNKPAAGRTVYVRGPKGFRVNLKTDKNGSAKFKIAGAGTYFLRTSVEEKKAGKDDGKDYSLIRHHATMILTLPLKK